MLGFGALGQFALGQASDPAVASVILGYDDSSSPERRKKRRKQQEEAVEEIAEKRLRLRGTIYDAIHPPEIFEPRQFDASIFARPNYPIVLPSDGMVSAVLRARMMEQQRKQALADQEEENDIAMLLGGA